MELQLGRYMKKVENHWIKHNFKFMRWLQVQSQSPVCYRLSSM